MLRTGLVPAAKAVKRVTLRGKKGFSVMPPEDLRRFAPIPAVAIPAHEPYLLADVDTGTDLLNVTPDDAMKILAKRKLGWCWAGNPHTWLGSASAARRI